MLLKADQQRVKALLTETVTLLCKNGLHFKSEFSIDGLIGITLDQQEIFLVKINETVKLDKVVNDDNDSEQDSPSPSGQSATTRKRRRQQASATTSVPPPGINSSSSLSSKPLSSLQGSSKYHSDNVVVPTSGVIENSTSTQDAAASDRAMISFSDVPIKLDFELNSVNENMSLTNRAGSADSRLANSYDPPLKRACRQTQPNEATEETSQQHSESRRLRTRESTSSSENRQSTSSNRYKTEPSEIIEIKEESLSDEEAKESMENYSTYVDYGCGEYGSSNSGLDVASQMYGESSGLQLAEMYQDEYEGNATVAKRSNDTIPLLIQPMDDFSARRIDVLRCPDCKKAFATSSGMRSHIRKIHQNEYRRYVCSICRKGFGSHTDLEGHMAHQHNAPKKYKCHICKKEFGYNSKLKLHMLLEKHIQFLT